jgi:hypothetical protein
MQYPGSTIGVRAPNTLSIIGSGAGAVSSAIGLGQAMERGQPLESQMLIDLFRKDSTAVYDQVTRRFLNECTLGDLDYIGRRIIALDAKFKKKTAKELYRERGDTALGWMTAYWLENFETTYAEVSGTSKKAPPRKPNSELRTYTSDQLADRLTMLSQLRLLLQCLYWSNQELITQQERLAVKQPDDPPKQ